MNSSECSSARDATRLSARTSTEQNAIAPSPRMRMMVTNVIDLSLLPAGVRLP